MDRYNWDSIAEEKMNDLMDRKVVHTPQATIARLTLKKGAIVPTHSHVNEQVTTVTSGSLEFDMAGERLVLGAGDVLVIPPHVLHAVVAIEDCTATDYFTPARADWINGDDSYLRQK